MTAQFRFPRFFVTSPTPCPYLPGKQERKVFTELAGAHASELSEALGKIGFRRSQGVAYRPSCLDCSACVSVRIVTKDFVPNATQRKLLRRHGDLDIKACRPWATSEQFDLLRRYLDTRHPDGGMAGMDDIDYADMVEQTPVTTNVIEYREPSANGRGRLVGACLTDQQNDGLSMIYSFFAPDDDARPGMGNFIIMDHILRAARSGLPYVYLGYWIRGSRRMEYKTKFRPVERLGPQGWSLFDPDADLAEDAEMRLPQLSF